MGEFPEAMLCYDKDRSLVFQLGRVGGRGCVAVGARVAGHAGTPCHGCRHKQRTSRCVLWPREGMLIVVECMAAHVASVQPGTRHL